MLKVVKITNRCKTFIRKTCWSRKIKSFVLLNNTNNHSLPFNGVSCHTGIYEKPLYSGLLSNLICVINSCRTQNVTTSLKFNNMYILFHKTHRIKIIWEQC